MRFSRKNKLKLIRRSAKVSNPRKDRTGQQSWEAYGMFAADLKNLKIHTLFAVFDQSPDQGIGKVPSRVDWSTWQIEIATCVRGKRVTNPLRVDTLVWRFGRGIRIADEKPAFHLLGRAIVFYVLRQLFPLSMGKSKQRKSASLWVIFFFYQTTRWDGFDPNAYSLRGVYVDLFDSDIEQVKYRWQFF